MSADRHPAASDASSAPAPVVSVIVPAYDAEATLGDTLASVRAQSYERFEALVVDDGSTDATAAIARRAAAEDPRIRLLSQTNGGVASARNHGIAEARGAWIATVDADDLWHPDKLAAQMTVAEGSPLGPVLVYSWSRRIDGAGRVLADQGRPTHRGDAFHQLLAFNFLGNASSALLRADVVREVGGFDAALHAAGAQGAEDVALYLAVAERGALDVAPGFLTGYRISSGSMSRGAARMRRSVELVLGGIERRRPDTPPRLLGLARSSYDLYAASLAEGAGDRRACASYIWDATRRRPGLTMAFLGCAALWRGVDQWATRRGGPPFDALDPMEPAYHLPLAEGFAVLRARAANRAAAARVRRADGIAGPVPTRPARPGGGPR